MVHFFKEGEAAKPGLNLSWGNGVEIIWLSGENTNYRLRIRYKPFGFFHRKKVGPNTVGEYIQYYTFMYGNGTEVL